MHAVVEGTMLVACSDEREPGVIEVLDNLLQLRSCRTGRPAADVDVAECEQLVALPARHGACTQSFERKYQIVLPSARLKAALRRMVQMCGQVLAPHRRAQHSVVQL